MTIREKLRSKFQCVRNLWMQKTPKEKWDILHNAAKSVGQMTGLRTHIGKENCWYVWLGALSLIVCYVLIFYTILYNFRYNEYIRIIENCSCLGILTYVSLRHVTL